jgi:hypothetical protein
VLLVLRLGAFKKRAESGRTGVQRLGGVLAKLFALVIIAFTWAYIVGIELDKLNPIKIKKHGRRAKSLMEYGLDYVTNILFFNDLIKFKEAVNFCHVLSIFLIYLCFASKDLIQLN